MSIYKVTVNATGANTEVLVAQTRLVRAKTKATAKNYAADKHIKVELASDTDLIQLTKDGVEVENAEKE